MTTPAETTGAGTTGAGTARTTRRAVQRRPTLLEVLVALACFAVLCGAALSRPVKLLEPDDYAYRASIVALSEGHVLLTDAQYRDLATRLRQSDSSAGMSRSRGISQWTRLDDGRWVSEKNPGYPFFAAPFEMLGLTRLTPLFYGALGCIALFAGGRRWLGAWGGTWTVGLFCSSGAALAFAWRAWMPTFTGAALLAAGAGALLWAVLASDAGGRRRTIVGLLGFLALEGAMLIRYTDAIALAVAVVAVLAAWRFAPGRLPRRALLWWLGSAVLAGGLVLAWNTAVYGSPSSTGYASGVVTFGLGALSGNFHNLPKHLVTTMPVSLLALAGLVWMAARSLRLRRTAPPGEIRPSRAAAHRDLAVAAALTAAWWGIWGLYFTYYWTAQTRSGPGGPGVGAGGAVHLIRFYVPALAPIALLAAWALVRLPRWLALTAVAAFFGLGLWSYAGMAATDARGGIMGRPGGFGGPPGGAMGGTPPAGLPGGTPPAGAPVPQGMPTPPGP